MSTIKYLWSQLLALFQTPPPDINYAAYSVTGSDFNPGALAVAPAGQVPVGTSMAPTNAAAFASLLKIADGRKNEQFTYPAANPIAQGSEGVVDVCNAVSGVGINATYGTGTSLGERVGSFKGTAEVTVTGQRNCNGTWATWIIGRYYNEGRAVDTKLTINVPGGGTFVIARGLFAYLFGNKNSISVVGCKLAFFKSLAEWALVVLKDIFCKTVPVVTTAAVQPPLATP